MTASGTCSKCDHFFLMLGVHQVQAHGRLGDLIRRERSSSCRLCLRGDHDRCVGIACRCTATARCEVNAALTAERETA